MNFTHPETGEVKYDQVFCTDILDVLTQDFFSRKGKGVVEESQQSSAVEDVKVKKQL